MAAVANALPATTISGSVLTTAETTPALQNVIASNKPTWGTLTAGGRQNTGGGPLYTQGGWINTGGAPLYSGSLNTGSISSGSINTNGQPITTGNLTVGSYEQMGWQSLCGNYGCSDALNTLYAQPCWNMVLYYTGYNSTSGCFPWGWYPSGAGLSYSNWACAVYVSGGVNNGASVQIGFRWSERGYEVIDVSGTPNCGVIVSGGVWWNTPLGTVGPSAPGVTTAVVTLVQ